MLDSTEVTLMVVQREYAELWRELEAAKAERLAIFTTDIPHGRGWSFIEDAKVLASSPDIEPATEARLLAQVKPPRLTTCPSRD